MATCENTYAVLVQDETVLLVTSFSSVNLKHWVQSDCDLSTHMYSGIWYATCMQHVCKAMCFSTRWGGGLRRSSTRSPRRGGRRWSRRAACGSASRRPPSWSCRFWSEVSEGLGKGMQTYVTHMHRYANDTHRELNVHTVTYSKIYNTYLRKQRRDRCAFY